MNGQIIKFNNKTNICSIDLFFGIDLSFNCSEYIISSMEDVFRDVHYIYIPNGFFLFRTGYGKVFGTRQGDSYFFVQIRSSHTNGTNLIVKIIIGKKSEFIKLYTVEQIKSVYKQIKFNKNVRKTISWFVRLNKNFNKMSDDDIGFCKSLVGEEKFNMAKFVYVDNAIGYVRHKNLFGFTKNKTDSCKYNIICHAKLKQYFIDYSEDLLLHMNIMTLRSFFMIPLKDFGYALVYFTPNDSSFNENIYVKLDYKNLDTSIYKADEKEIADVHSDFIKRIMIQSKLSNVDVYDILLRLDENFSKTD